MEYGNFVIHCLLRDLRPPGIALIYSRKIILKFSSFRCAFTIGTKERKIPFPNSNPMSILQNFVSCPNYTYEVWLRYFMFIIDDIILLYEILMIALMLIEKF